MQKIVKRLAALAPLWRPLALMFFGVMLLSLGASYFVLALSKTIEFPPLFAYLTLQPLDRWMRGVVVTAAGLLVLAAGVWRLSTVAIIPLDAMAGSRDELVLGYKQATDRPRVAVLAGGAGILRLADVGRRAKQVTCITPVQDQVEYYYRAASLFNFENVLYVPPTPGPIQVFVTLDDGTRHNVKDDLVHDERLAERHVVDVALDLDSGNGATSSLEVLRQASQAIAEADVILLGPGSLFVSIIPNLLVPGIRDAIKRSKARTIFICNLMTEPGLTTGLSVADHIRQIARFGGFVPDYVLVNAQRIEPEIRRVYEAANQAPVHLNPEEYEETIVSATDRAVIRDVVVEGAVVIETDLASSVVQLTTSLLNPGESRAVQVLRHDPEKLATAIAETMKRS